MKVACGGFHTLALSSENELFAWGGGSYGECGYGDFYDTSKPKLVKMPYEVQIREEDDDEGPLDQHMKENVQIRSIAAGGHHSLVVS